MAGQFEHQRHKPPAPLERPRQLVLALPPLRSNVNSARIVRAAGCCGVRRIILAGAGKIDRKIARDSLDFVQIERHRTLLPVLKRLRHDGYQLVGLEQTTGSKNLHDFLFPEKTVLVIGHERQGIADEVLACLDAVVEIPVYGKPFSYNVATATAMALYEYCRQWRV